MKITQALLDKLTEEAKASPRLRMNYDLRNSDQDQSQRMLNAIEPGSPLPIHRHTKSSETVVCLRGRLVWEFYQEVSSSKFNFVDFCHDSAKQVNLMSLAAPKVQDSGSMTKVDEVELSPNGPVVALNIPIGQWHTVRALESGSVILETKDGAYRPLQDDEVLHR